MIKRFLSCNRISDCIHSTCRVYACMSAVYRILRALYCHCMRLYAVCVAQAYCACDALGCIGPVCVPRQNTYNVLFSCTTAGDPCDQNTDIMHSNFDKLIYFF